MRTVLQLIVAAALATAVAACSNIEDPAMGGSGGSGGSAGTGGSGGSGGTAGSGGSGGDGGTGGSGTGGDGGSGGSGTGPKVSLTATPTNVTASGAEAELVWEVTDADTCTATDGWGGLRTALGGSEIRPIFGNKRFEISCTGLGGVETSDEATVDLSGSQLQVTINMNYYLVLAGDIFVVNVTVANPGDTMVPGVTTNLLIPQHVIINENDLPLNASCTDGDIDDICDVDTEIEFNMGNIDAGATTEATVMPEVAMGIPADEPIRFRADVSSSDGAPDATFMEQAEEGVSDLELILGQSPSQAQAGDVLIYNLGYENTGSELLENVLLILTLPDHTTLAGVPTGNVTIGAGTVTWNVGNVMPGESGTVEAGADVDPFLPQGVPLRARADAQATKDGEVVRARVTSQAELSSGPVVISAHFTPNRVGVGGPNGSPDHDFKPWGRCDHRADR